MKTKNLMVSFVAIAMALFLVASVSATTDMVSSSYVKVNGLSPTHVSVVGDETISVEVYFTSKVDASNVRIKAEIEGDKLDVEARTGSFDIEQGQSYKKTLTLKVPYELKDEISNDIALNIKIWNGDYKKEFSPIVLRVQRASYNAEIKSINLPQTLNAGETFPVEVVLKNRGYNDLNDLYVTARIPTLGIEKTSYFGDLVAIESDDEDENTASGKFYLSIPYDVKSGVYVLEVEVLNDDLTSTVTKQIAIKNDFSKRIIVTSDKKTVNVGQNAVYELLVVNPTNQLKVYRIVTESSDKFSSNAEESVFAIPAGSSKAVKVNANANSGGEYDFDVNVFSGEELVGTVSFSLDAEGNSVTNPIVVLTVVLAIIFLVLLIVLIVLVTKKPQKSEEFGESYY